MTRNRVSRWVFRSVLAVSASAALSLFAGTSARALQITVTFSGTIDGAGDNTGALTGSNITSASTFTGSFSYDSASAPTVQGANAALYPSGPFEITIDGQHVFQATVPLNFRIQNDDPNFYDTFEFFANSGATFPFTYNPNDQLLRVSLRDSTNSVFSDTSSPRVSISTTSRCASCSSAPISTALPARRGPSAAASRA